MKPHSPKDKGLLDRDCRASSGRPILIVIHSNTIPQMANERVGRSNHSDWDDDICDNLLIIFVPAEGNSNVLRIRLGAQCLRNSESLK